MLTKSAFDERLNIFKNISTLSVDNFETSVGDITKNLTAVLHGLKNVNMSIIVGGDSNVGKTAVIKHLFVDSMGRQRYGKFFEENVKSKNQPDVTISVTRLPFGSGDPSHPGIVIYDIPGLDADETGVNYIAKVALGDEITPWVDDEWEDEIKDQKGIKIEVIRSREEDFPEKIDGKDRTRKRIKIERRKELQQVPFHFYSLPPTLHAPAEYEVKLVSVNDISKIIGDRPLTCLFIVDGSSSSLHREILQERVAWVKEKFDGKVVFAKTFRDKLEESDWDKERIDERESLLNNILGADRVNSFWINGKTGEGVDTVAMQIMKLNGYDNQMGTQLEIEIESRRLFSASRQIPGVIIPAFFTQALPKDAYISQALAKDAETELSDILSFLTNFLIATVYIDPDKDPYIETFRENLKKFIASMKDSIIDEKVAALRRKRTMWERLGRWWFGGDEYKTVYHRVREIARTPEALANVYYWVYTIIHAKELKRSEDMIEPTKVSVINPKVPEEEGIKWFVDQFKPHEELIMSNDDEAGWIFYQAIGTDTLTNFFQTYHPEILPIHKPTHEESTE